MRGTGERDDMHRMIALRRTDDLTLLHGSAAPFLTFALVAAINALTAHRWAGRA